MPSPSSPLSIIRATPVSHQHLCQSPPSLLSASHQHSHLCLSSPLAEPPWVISITLVSLQEQLSVITSSVIIASSIIVIIILASHHRHHHHHHPCQSSLSSSSSSPRQLSSALTTTQHHHHHSCISLSITGAKKGHDSSHWQAFRAEPKAHPKVQSHRAMKQRAPPLERDP